MYSSLQFWRPVSRDGFTTGQAHLLAVAFQRRINSAVPMKKYMNFCKQLARDADPRLSEWIKCVQEKRTCNGP